MKWWVQWLKWAVCWLGGPTHLRDHQGVWVVEGASWWTGGQEFQSPEAFRELVLRCPMVLETWVRKLLVSNLRLDVQQKWLQGTLSLPASVPILPSFVVFRVWFVEFFPVAIHDIFCPELNFHPKTSQKIPKSHPLLLPKNPFFWQKISRSWASIVATAVRLHAPDVGVSYDPNQKVTATWGAENRRLCSSQKSRRWTKPQWWQKLNRSDPNWSWYVFWLYIYIEYDMFAFSYTDQYIFYICTMWYIYILTHFLNISTFFPVIFTPPA